MQKQQVTLRAEDRYVLGQLADMKRLYPGKKVRMDWLRERCGAHWDEILAIRARLKRAGLWDAEDDCTFRRVPVCR